jgi:hypothetical protein
MASGVPLPSGRSPVGESGSPNGHVAFVDLRAQTQALQPALTAAIGAVLGRGDFVLGEDVERFESEFAA